jgi:succinoglycan biosynthesis protein ExoO
MPDSTGGDGMMERSDFWISPRPPAPEVRASVVIPSYGAAATLRRAVDSALAQSLRDIEVIVVDDASPDGSWPLIADLMQRDSRVRAVRNKCNQGKSMAMNRAVSIAHGRWLAVLDADDWYHPDRLEALIDAAEHRRVEMIADNQSLFDAQAGQIVGTAWPEGDACWPLSFDDFLLGSNAYENFNLGMLKPVMRVDFMRRVGLGYEATARQGEDFFHLLEFYLRGGAALVCDTPYYYYTQPFGSISREWSHAERSRYDFRNAFEINQRYLDEFGTGMNRGQRRRLMARNRGLEVLENYFLAKEAAAENRWTEVALTLARHPGALLHLARRLHRRLSSHADPATISRIAARARRRDPSIEDDHA